MIDLHVSRLPSTQSTNTAQHKDIIPTPNQLLPQWLVASAHTTTTSPLHYGYSDLFSDMLVARLPSLTCLSCSFKMIGLFLRIIFSTVIAHGQTYVRQYTTSRRRTARMPTCILSIDVVFGSKASPALLLWFCSVFDALGNTHRRRQTARDRKARIVSFN